MCGQHIHADNNLRIFLAPKWAAVMSQWALSNNSYLVTVYFYLILLFVVLRALPRGTIALL